jgi:ATP-dependent RNA helicase DDX47/RRP3
LTALIFFFFLIEFFDSKSNMATFEELGVIPELCLACKKLNYTVPSPIQAQAIPAALAGNDIIGLAQTGRYLLPV